MDKSILLKDINIGLFDKKRVLITGGTGLVGTHFLYAFRFMREAGIDLDVFATIHNDIPPHLKDMAAGGVVFLPSDTYIKSDLVIHGATYAQPYRFMEKKVETIGLNTTLTARLLSSYLNDGGRFLFLSSSEIYSGLNKMIYDEGDIGTTDPSHPRACYIESKRCGETIVNAFREMGVDAKSARLSLAYGEGTRRDDKRVLNSFIQQALVNKEIRLLDSGSARRTYIYVGDAVNMMLRILSEGRQCVYNVGGKSSISIEDLARMVGRLTGVKVIIPHIEESMDGAPTNVSLANWNYIDEFGLKYFIPLEEGLRKTVQYQKKLYSI